MDNKTSFLTLCLVSLFIIGNMIGAGILALPVNTGISGLFPALTGMLIYGGATLYTAVVLSRESCRQKKGVFNYPSLYGAHLGSAGKWVAITANLILLYGLLTAYLAGATVILANTLPLPLNNTLVLVVLFAVFSLAVVKGLKFAQKYNALLMVLLFLTFFIIVGMGEKYVQPKRYAYTDWVFLPLTIPIIVTSLNFHAIIPTVCRTLEWDIAKITRVVFSAIAIGYLMNALWIQVGVGALPLSDGDNSIVYAFDRNMPATVPLSKLVALPLFGLSAALFALLAIATSYLSCGVGLMEFFNDLLANQFKKHSRALVFFLTFVPPLLVSVLFPDVFIKALDISGGLGVVVLFGILPSIIGVKRATARRSRTLAYLILILFCIALIYEAGQELGFLKIKPHIEYHLPGLPIIKPQK